MDEKRCTYIAHISATCTRNNFSSTAQGFDSLEIDWMRNNDPGSNAIVVRTAEQILPYCVIRTEHSGGVKTAGRPMAANSRPTVVRGRPPAARGRGRGRPRPAQPPPYPPPNFNQGLPPAPPLGVVSQWNGTQWVAQSSNAMVPVVGQQAPSQQGPTQMQAWPNQTQLGGQSLSAPWQPFQFQTAVQQLPSYQPVPTNQQQQLQLLQQQQQQQQQHQQPAPTAGPSAAAALAVPPHAPLVPVSATTTSQTGKQPKRKSNKNSRNQKKGKQPHPPSTAQPSPSPPPQVLSAIFDANNVRL